MHKDTKNLIGILIGLIVASAVIWLAAGQLPHWMHHEGLTPDEAASHAIHVGLYQSVLVYTSIAFAIFAFVSFCFSLLILLKLENERPAPVGH